jgi:hypothetical protein
LLYVYCMVVRKGNRIFKIGSLLLNVCEHERERKRERGTVLCTSVYIIDFKKLLRFYNIQHIGLLISCLATYQQQLTKWEKVGKIIYFLGAFD